MLVPFIRTLILYLVIVAVLRLMGKRQVGELQPGELVITILVSAVASVPLQDVEIPLLHGIVPILTLMAAEVLISCISRRHIAFRRLMSGNPVPVIRDGAFLQSSIRKLRLSIDDLLAVLRLGGYFDLREIDSAVVETNGQLSVQLKRGCRPATAGDLGVKPTPAGPFCTIISDGRVISANLASIGRDERWLDELLRARGAQSAQDVFYLSGDAYGNIVFAAREEAR